MPLTWSTPFILVWVASKPLDSSYFYPSISANTCAPGISVGSRDSTQAQCLQDEHFTKHTITLTHLGALVCLRHHSQCYSHGLFLFFFFFDGGIYTEVVRIYSWGYYYQSTFGFTKGHSAWWIYIVSSPFNHHYSWVNLRELWWFDSKLAR